MSAALLLALPAILMIALATPRQAAELLGHRIGPTGRHRLRGAGLALLAASAALLVLAPDPVRAAVGWIGGIGIEALTVALLFTAVARRA